MVFLVSHVISSTNKHVLKLILTPSNLPSEKDDGRKALHLRSPGWDQLPKMNVNRKLDRFKQWAGERMGGEVKTNVSDDFKALEEEMTVRHEGTASRQLLLPSAIVSSGVLNR